MRILLTGITGFVGSHMCDYILKNMENIESVKIFEHAGGEVMILILNIYMGMKE